MQCCPKDFRQYYTRKILLNVALILLGQYYTGKNLVQCCPRGFRQHCPGKNYVQSYLNTPAQCCQRDTTQHCTVWITCLFGDFYFKLVNFLMITSCSKCSSSVAQIFPTLAWEKSWANTEQKHKILRNTVMCTGVYYGLLIHSMGRIVTRTRGQAFGSKKL